MIVKSKVREFVPLILVFILFNGFFVAGRSFLERWNASQDVLIGGNLLLFVITFFSFLVAKRGLRQTNPHAFTRAVYTSILLKLFLTMIAAFAYIAINKSALNKPALFTLMGLYLVYTFLEVSILVRMLKNKNNG